MYHLKTTETPKVIRIVNYAFCKKQWEEFNLANNYSVDATYEFDIKLKMINKILSIFHFYKETLIQSVK
jgi:hypothetical protein